jgi:hypothetical protein
MRDMSDIAEMAPIQKASSRNDDLKKSIAALILSRSDDCRRIVKIIKSDERHSEFFLKRIDDLVYDELDGLVEDVETIVKHVLNEFTQSIMKE